MNRGKKILFLLLINLGLVFVSLYVLDNLQILDYKQILNQVPLLRQTYKVKIEDPYLLEKTELEKKWQILDEKNRNLSEERKKLEEEKRSLQLDKEKVEKERENVKNMIDNFEKMKAEKETYDKRIEEVAQQIENMPPEASIKILSRQDDMMLIDLFKKMNMRAENSGGQSLVPYLMSLLDPEQSARIQRKMLE